MAKPRRTGRAVLRTYINPRHTLTGETFEARVIVVGTRADVKNSQRNAEDAVSKALLKAQENP